MGISRVEKTDNIMRKMMGVQKRAHMLMRRYSREYGVNPNEVQILLTIHHHQVDTAKEIGAHTGFSRSQMSKQVDSLIKNGYLTSTQDTEDRRVFHLSLTNKAHSFMHEIDEMKDWLNVELFKGITEEEMKMVTEIIDKILKNSEVLYEESL